MRGSADRPAHRRWARLAWPRTQLSTAATAPVAARHGGEEGPGRDSRGQGEGGGAGGARGWTRGSSGRWRCGVASSASRPWRTRPCSAHASMAPRARERRGRAEGVRASALGFDAYLSRAPRCSREAGACVGMVGRARQHGCHKVNSSSTWRALLCRLGVHFRHIRCRFGPWRL